MTWFTLPVYSGRGLGRGHDRVSIQFECALDFTAQSVKQFLLVLTSDR